MFLFFWTTPHWYITEFLCGKVVRELRSIWNNARITSNYGYNFELHSPLYQSTTPEIGQCKLRFGHATFPHILYIQYLMYHYLLENNPRDCLGLWLPFLRSLVIRLTHDMILPFSIFLFSYWPQKNKTKRLLVAFQLIPLMTL